MVYAEFFTIRYKDKYFSLDWLKLYRLDLKLSTSILGHHNVLTLGQNEVLAFEWEYRDCAHPRQHLLIDSPKFTPPLTTADAVAGPALMVLIITGYVSTRIYQGTLKNKIYYSQALKGRWHA